MCEYKVKECVFVVQSPKNIPPSSLPHHFLSAVCVSVCFHHLPLARVCCSPLLWWPLSSFGIGRLVSISDRTPTRAALYMQYRIVSVEASGTVDTHTHTHTHTYLHAQISPSLPAKRRNSEGPECRERVFAIKEGRAPCASDRGPTQLTPSPQKKTDEKRSGKAHANDLHNGWKGATENRSSTKQAAAPSPSPSPKRQTRVRCEAIGTYTLALEVSKR